MTPEHQYVISPTQKIFAEAILAGRTNAQSYSKAYQRKSCNKYEQGQGNRLARNVYVRKYLDLRRQEIVEREQVNTDKIIAEMWKIAQDSESTTAARVSALTQLGKWLGLKSEEDDKGGKGNVSITIINFKDMYADRKSEWRKLTGERYSAVQLQTKAVSGTDVECIRERGNEDSTDKSPEIGQGSGHAEQGN